MGPLAKIGEGVRLLGVNLLFSLCSSLEYAKVVWHYYGNRCFRRADLALLRRYLCSNPYRLHKQCMLQRGSADPYGYGETYLTTFATMMADAALADGDTYYELGCGRGRTCFWARCFSGCRVVGIDFVPEFIRRAQAVVAQLALPGIEFRCADYSDGPIDAATVLYVDATLLQGEELARLVRLLDGAGAGTRLLAVNFEPPAAAWRRLRRRELPFPWGCSEVGLFRKEG